MHHFEISDPNVGFGQVMMDLDACGIRSDSRNGPVIRFPGPCALEYTDPRRRILSHPIREANHFFHLFETIWMFAGLNTVAPLDPYNSGMKQYSDNGVTFAAAYGHRWRVKWGDQIAMIVDKLRKDRTDRRVVLQMWDPMEIFQTQGKDFACNQQVLFSTRNEGVVTYLDITVTNRSNDLVYGAMGSNLFHFSLLHEFIAYHADLSVGRYTQFSVNMHLYLENETSKRCWEAREQFADIPAVGSDDSLSTYGIPLGTGPHINFVNHGIAEGGYLEHVVKPIALSYQHYKDKAIPLQERLDGCRIFLTQCLSEPLRQACDEWFQRRYK